MFVPSFYLSALARRASDNSNSGKQPAEADPNKKKNIRKAKGGIKVPSSVQHEGLLTSNFNEFQPSVYLKVRRGSWL